MEIIEYPVQGIQSYTARIIKGKFRYTVELYLKPDQEEKEDLPLIVKVVNWLFDEPGPTEEPILERDFPYSVSWVDAINRTVWEYERPIRYQNELLEWDGQVFEPPATSPRSAQGKEEPQLIYEVQEVPVKDQDGKPKTINYKVPNLVGGKKPRNINEMGWRLQQEKLKARRVRGRRTTNDQTVNQQAAGQG